MPPATQLVQAMQQSQPARLSVRFFCVRGVLPVKAMPRATHLGWAFDLAQDRCWQSRLQK
jgi:hypothetical protein